MFNFLKFKKKHFFLFKYNKTTLIIFFHLTINFQKKFYWRIRNLSLLITNFWIIKANFLFEKFITVVKSYFVSFKNLFNVLKFKKIHFFLFKYNKTTLIIFFHLTINSLKRILLMIRYLSLLQLIFELLRLIFLFEKFISVV